MLTRRGRRYRSQEDGGFTLTEVIVSMGLFTILLAVMMSAIVQWSAGAVRGARAADLAAESQVVFNTFDQNVLSAAEINRPVKVGADWYVEVMSTAVTPAQCTQWVLRSDGRLQTRSWSSPTTGRIAPPAWTTKGTRFVLEAGQPPFTMLPVGATDRQALRVDLAGRASATSGIVRTTGTFVARNSTDQSVTNPDISPADGRSDVEVCINDLTSGGRA